MLPVSSPEFSSKCLVFDVELKEDDGRQPINELSTPRPTWRKPLGGVIFYTTVAALDSPSAVPLGQVFTSSTGARVITASAGCAELRPGCSFWRHAPANRWLSLRDKPAVLTVGADQPTCSTSSIIPSALAFVTPCLRMIRSCAVQPARIFAQPVSISTGVGSLCRAAMSYLAKENALAVFGSDDTIHSLRGDRRFFHAPAPIDFGAGLFFVLGGPRSANSSQEKAPRNLCRFPRLVFRRALNHVLWLNLERNIAQKLRSRTVRRVDQLRDRLSHTTVPFVAFLVRSSCECPACFVSMNV